MTNSYSVAVIPIEFVKVVPTSNWCDGSKWLANRSWLMQRAWTIVTELA